MKTPVSIEANRKPASPPLVIYRALMAAKEMNIPLWKVMGGLLSQWDKMYIIAQFGAATEKLKAATIHGDIEKDGVQFIGQSMGLIDDIPSVDDLVHRILDEAAEASSKNMDIFSEKVVAGDDINASSSSSSSLYGITE